MAGGGAVRTELRRESKRERDGAHRVGEEVVSALELSTGGGGGLGAGRACMPSTRRRCRDAVRHARGAAVSEREEGGDAGAGRPGRLRWLGRLVGAGPPVNSPLSHFFFLISFSKSLNAIFEALATFFRS